MNIPGWISETPASATVVGGTLRGRVKTEHSSRVVEPQVLHIECDKWGRCHFTERSGGGGDDDERYPQWHGDPLNPPTGGGGGGNGGAHPLLDDATCYETWQECMRFCDNAPTPQLRLGCLLGCDAVYAACRLLPERY